MRLERPLNEILFFKMSSMLESDGNLRCRNWKSQRSKCISGFPPDKHAILIRFSAQVIFYVSVLKILILCFSASTGPGARGGLYSLQISLNHDWRACDSLSDATFDDCSRLHCSPAGENLQTQRADAAESAPGAETAQADNKTTSTNGGGGRAKGLGNRLRD